MARTVREDHCWHTEDLETIKAIKSTVLPVICCWCNKKGSATLSLKQIPGHGPCVLLNQLDYPTEEVCVSG